MVVTIYDGLKNLRNLSRVINKLKVENHLESWKKGGGNFWA